MKRYRQTLEEIEKALRPINASWRDPHADKVISSIRGIPEKRSYAPADIGRILDDNFEVGQTLIRLFLDLSKDESTQLLKDQLGQGGIGVKRYKSDPKTYLDALAKLGLLEAMTHAVNRPLHWTDTLIERLKGGRGSAIKGQKRGRQLEDFVEDVLMNVFAKTQIDARCRFAGAKGQSTEKADFAIPSRADPHILIEVKAYGATGSKQTDVLGDVYRIIEEKRNDTSFLLITDGITWKERRNDLRKLVELQNYGRIMRIYTMMMKDELISDLRTLKVEFGLDSFQRTRRQV